MTSKSQRLRRHLTFLLNGETVRLDGVAPAAMLLAWLRGERGMAGTKEGCAEGGCGACTVLVGRLRNEGVRYRTLNACLLPLPALEGTSVITVEGVTGDGGSLHPVQRALVSMHGSQCGFCTPGFVMSLYGLYLATDAMPGEHAIDDTLAGNLCRCTGYGPIVAAGRTMFEGARPAADAARRDADARALAAIAHGDMLRLEGGGATAFGPATEDELADIYAAHPSATLIAGATDAGLWVTKALRRPEVAIFLNRVAGLDAVTTAGANGREVRIGASATHADALAAIGRLWPTLAALWHRFGGPQVRNAGTVGGNIANGSPIGDLAPVLIALGARLHLRQGAERREIALEDFFIAYGRQDRRAGEFITALTFDDRHGDPRHFRCFKVSKRFDDDISAVCGAFQFRIETGVIVGARVAYGGMAATPKRAAAVEGRLAGQPWTRATVAAAAEALAADFTPLSDARASAHYRMDVARNLLLRAYLDIEGLSPRLADLAPIGLEAGP